MTASAVEKVRGIREQGEGPQSQIMKPYPEYKDSGIEWLGDFPSGWKAKRLKYLCDLQTGDKDTVDAVPGGEYNLFVRAQKVEKIDEYTHDCEAVLTAGDGVGVGKVFHYTNGKFSFHQRVYMMNSFKGMLARFFFYYLSTLFSRVALDGGAKSTVDSLRMPVFTNFRVCVPSFVEQNAIVAYLDRETARIDNLIVEKQNFINLLKETRQALISHVVTKGPDPKAKMKESGVEWIGEVPEHWEIVSHRRVIKKIEQGWSPQTDANPPNETQWGVTKLSAVKGGKFFPAECKAMLEEHDPSDGLQVKEGDLLLTRANTPNLVGDVCLVSGLSDQKIILCDLIYRVSYLSSVNKKYMVYWLLSSPGRSQIKADARGSSMTMAKISQAHIKEWKVPVPPRVEQDVVVALLDSKLEQLDTIVTEVENSIELLKEHRTALISAAVTGKIDVRDQT